jgi:universal stress protein A
MKIYHHILVAVDLHAKCDKRVIERAKALAEANLSNISLVHAVEHINAYGVAEAYSAVLDVEEQMITEAKKQLQKLGQELGIPENRLYLEVGSPKSVILNKANELKNDLIVVGSHGRHGIQLLLGSTANAVLHHAKVDVLAVRVQE